MQLPCNVLSTSMTNKDVRKTFVRAQTERPLNVRRRLGVWVMLYMCVCKVEKTKQLIYYFRQVERDHDDSMVTSICDIILQKPNLRRDLIEYVKQEKESVMNMLDKAAQSKYTCT